MRCNVTVNPYHQIERELGLLNNNMIDYKIKKSLNNFSQVQTESSSKYNSGVYNLPLYTSLISNR